MSTCFFIGHRDAPETLLLKLIDEIERHVTDYGVTDFVIGNYGRFDALAAQGVKTVKECHLGVSLTLLRPYYQYSQSKFPAGFDSSFYPPGVETVPKRAAIVYANRYMVDHSEYLIAYAWQAGSNARNLLEYAQKRKVKGFLNITEITR